MSSLIPFLIYEAAVFFLGICAVTHPDVTSLPMPHASQFLIFMTYAVLAIGGMVEFIKSWTKD